MPSLAQSPLSPIENPCELTLVIPAFNEAGNLEALLQRVIPLLERLSTGSDLALVTYPNAGRAWDPVTGWQGEGEESGDDLVRAWAAIDGVRLIGGCCGVGPDSIARIAATLTT